MARWGLWHQLSHPTWKELYLCVASEGPDWKLLLLPLPCIPQGCWWIWWLQDPESSVDSCALPSSCCRLYFVDWRLVQGQPQCKLLKASTILFHPTFASISSLSSHLYYLDFFSLECTLFINFCSHNFCFKIFSFVGPEEQIRQW